MEELGRVIKETLARKNISKNTPVSPGSEKLEEPKCPVCKGKGWVVLDVPEDHEDFGKSFTCRCKLLEMASGQVDRLKRFSNLGPLVRLTFENLDSEGLSPEPENRKRFGFACEKARDFSADPSGWLVLTGPSGCGKTHMAAAVANDCISRGIPVFWTIVPDFLDYLRGTFSPQSEVTYDDLFERVKNAELLILDDLGTHSSTPWAEEKLFQVINHRFNAQLPTVITTIDIDDLDERLQTRLRNAALSRELRLKIDALPLYSDVSGLSMEVITTMRFSAFEVRGMCTTEEQRTSLKTAVDAAKRFADSPENWLVLIGPSGCGKTHMAAAVANRQIDAGRPVFFVSVPEFLDRLRSAMSSDSRKDKELGVEVIKTTPFLILDDFGMGTSTAWVRDKLYQILNYRYNARLATLITASDPAWENLDDRLRSRLEDLKISNVVPIGAPDYRSNPRDRKKKSPRKT